MQLLSKAIFVIFIFMTNLHAFANLNDDYLKYIGRDSVEGVKELINDGYDPNTVLPNGNTLLNAAILENAFKTAKYLINHKKIKIDLRNKSDETPLMLACLRGNLDLVKLLVYRGADVNKPGWTPLHYAASAGHVGIMKFLIDKYAYIDASSPSGNTPLMMATLYGDEESVLYLLSQEADPTILNGAKKNAIQLAKASERFTLAEILEESSKKWLIEAAQEKAITDKADVELQKQIAEEKQKLKKMAEEKQLALIRQQQQDLQKQEELLKQETLARQQAEIAKKKSIDLLKKSTPAQSTKLGKNTSPLLLISRSFPMSKVALESNGADQTIDPGLVQLEQKVLSLAPATEDASASFKVATIEAVAETTEVSNKAENQEEDFEVLIDPITSRLIKVKKQSQ